MRGGGAIDYPKVKLLVNRLANYFIKVLFQIRLNDTTNAFKAYRKEVIDGCQPLIAPHFDATIEHGSQSCSAHTACGLSKPELMALRVCPVALASNCQACFLLKQN